MCTSPDQPPVSSPVLPPFIFDKWRRLTPAKLSKFEPTSMRAMELDLKARWSKRLVYILLPYATEMPEVGARVLLADPIREISDLFGLSRWGGLKGRVTDIERAIRLKPDILVPIYPQMQRAHQHP